MPDKSDTFHPFKAVALLVLVLAIYLPSLNSDFIWDDDYYVTGNAALTNLKGLADLWITRDATVQYYPMVFTSFWIEYQVFGPEPAVFHASNMVFHGINAILVWLILMRLGLPWAWLAAAVFALHPVNVESVAWISERKNVLSGLFALSSLLLLVRLYLTDTDKTLQALPPLKKKPYALYGASLFLFILALLSKSVTCMMPVVFLLLVWWKHKKMPRNIIYAMLPFFAVGLAAGINTSLIEKLHVGAHGLEWNFSIMERILIAGRALWFYACKLIWPAELIFFYPRWEVDATVWWQYLFPGTFLVLFLTLLTARHRTGKGPAAGVAAFAVALLPALGFINYYPMRYSFVADHFQYLASITMIALAVAGLHRMVERRNQRTRLLMIGFCTVILLVLGIRSWQEQDKYKNLQTLWEDTLSKHPDCWIANHNLGCVLAFLPGHKDRAVKSFFTALEIQPDHLETRYNLARLFSGHGNYDAAMEHYEYLLEQDQAISTTLLANIHNDMGVIFATRRQFEAAEAHFRKALQLKPHFPDAYNNLNRMMIQADEDLSENAGAVTVAPGR